MVVSNLGKFFTKISQDSVAFSKNEVAILDRRDQTKRINLQIFLAFMLPFRYVQPPRLMRDVSDIQKSFNSSARLTANAPIKYKLIHIYLINQTNHNHSFALIISTDLNILLTCLAVWNHS